MFCTNCGKEIKEGASFCANCGAKVKQANNSDMKTVLENDSTEETVKKVAQSDYKEGFNKESTNEIQDNLHSKADDTKDDESIRYEFKHNNKKITVEVEEDAIHITSGSLLKKDKRIPLQDIANITLRKYVSFTGILEGVIIGCISIAMISSEGLTWYAGLIGLAAIATILYRNSTLLIFDRNNQLTTIVTDDKEKCEKFVNTINRRLDEKGIPRFNPASFKEPFYQTNTAKIVAVFLVLLCIAVFALGLSDEGQVAQVKDASWNQYPDATVGEIIDVAISEPTWSAFTTESGQEIIEVKGYLNNGEDFLMQFLIKESSWSVYAVQMGSEVSTDDFSIGLVVAALISNYDDIYGTGTYTDELNAKIIEELSW